MAGSFGGSVKLKGESEYTKALKTITSNLTLMASEMKVVSSAFDKNDKSVQAITSRNSVLEKEIEECRKKINTYKTALEDFTLQQDESARGIIVLMMNLEKEKKKLEEMKSSTTATSKEIKDQEKIVADLSTELAGNEAQYEKNKLTLNKYKTELNNTQAQMNTFSNELEENKASLQDNKDAFTKLNEKIDSQKEKLNTLKNAYASAVLEQGKSSSEAKSLKKEIKELSDDIEKNEKTVDKSTKALDDFTKAESDAGKGSITLGDLIKGNLISEAIIGGFKGLVNSIKSLSNAMSDCIAISQNVEEQEQKFRTALTNTTDATEEDIQAYVRLAEQKEKNGVVSKSAILNGYQELATYTTQKESIEALTDAMLDMTVQQYGMNATEEQTLSIATRLGKALSNGDYSGLAKMGYYFTDAEKQAMKFGTEEDRVNALLEAITGSVGGMNEALAQTNAGKLRIATSYIDDMKESIGTLASDTKAQLMADFLPTIQECSTAIAGMVSGDIGIEEGFEMITSGLMNGISMIQSKLPDLLNIGMSLVQQVLNGISAMLPQLVPMAVNVITTLATGLIQMLPEILQMGITIIVELANGLAQSLPTLVPVIIDAIMLLIETIIDNLDQIIDAGINIILALADGLIEALPKLIDKIPVIIEKLINAITENLPKIIEMGVTLIVKLAVGLIKAIPQLVSKIPEIISALVKGLGDGIGKMAEVGLNLVKGLWNGINNAKDWVLDKIKGFGKSILNGIKSFFGIHSPSSVFRDEIGSNLALGIGEGFEEEMASVKNDIEDAIPKDFDLGINTNLDGLEEINQSFSKEVLVDAFREALSGMTFKAFDETFGELVIDNVEKVVYS